MHWTGITKVQGSPSTKQLVKIPPQRYAVCHGKQQLAWKLLDDEALVLLSGKVSGILGREAADLPVCTDVESKTTQQRASSLVRGSSPLTS